MISYRIGCAAGSILIILLCVSGVISRNNSTIQINNSSDMFCVQLKSNYNKKDKSSHVTVSQFLSMEKKKRMVVERYMCVA